MTVNGVNGSDPIEIKDSTNVAGNGKANEPTNAFEDEDIALGATTDGFVKSNTTDTEVETPKNPLEGKPGVTVDENGNATIKIQAWNGSTPLEGNESSNNCLERIWNNYYKKEGVSWSDFSKAFMASNQQIYSDEASKKRGSRTGTLVETYIYTDETVNLPSLKDLKEGKAATVASVPDNGTVPKQGSGNNGSGSNSDVEKPSGTGSGWVYNPLTGKHEYRYH